MRIPTKTNGFRIISDGNIPKNKKIAVISPHPDDSCINIGGTIAKLSKKNEIHIFVMTCGNHSVISGISNRKKIAEIRKNEAECESKKLNCKMHFCNLGFYEDIKRKNADIKFFASEIGKFNPDILIVPMKEDHHQTHQTSREVALNSIVRCECKPEIWEYETTWSLFSPHKFNTLVCLTKNDMDKKIEAVSCHQSQIRRVRFDKAQKSLAEFRAIVVPEQELCDHYGEKPIDLGNYLEVFYVKNN